ncbi:MAG: DUF1836 domain-containing protein [Clostridia bacterium]|nr:DUF1836 domain-containing protein [Clostridia bacterium]MBQ8716359.1 DUF1836 domain-containing protein [Clostridia bacterium]
MTEKELLERIKTAVADADLADTDIPAIDLYLDQILSLVADKNATSAPRYRERALTKTMINNYSKDGLISPITGKKYSRSHIVEMLLVYALKNTLSIDEIKRVLTGVREECGFTGEDMIRAYHQFLSLKENNRTRAGEIVHTMLGEDALGVESDYDFFLSLLDILSLSAYLKEIGRELLESRYKDLALRDQEIKQREEQEKKEGKEQAGAEKRERKAKKVQEKAERKIAKLDATPVADVIGDRD